MMRATLWLPLTALSALVVLTFWLERQVRLEAHRPTSAGKGESDMIINNFNAIQMAPDGSLRYRLHAEKMTHYPAGDTSRLDKVSFETQSPDQPRIGVRANSGTVTQGGEMLVMEGNVVMNADATATAPAWTISTQRLTVLPQESMAKSDVEVRFESPDLNMTATSFTYNTKARVADLKNIRAVYASRKGLEKK